MSKRILSLVLALVMVLGTFGTVFAAETAAVTVEKDAATFLKEAKVLLGDDKGDLNLDLKLERRDMVVLLSRLMGEEEVAAKFPVTKDSPTWEDVRTDAYYLPSLAWGQVNEFFEGKTAKAFGPREAMTAQDYSLVLLRALGYEVTGHDAWKAALKDAKELGILANVVVEDATEITRGQMSVMTLNTLGAKVKDSTKTLAEELGIKLPVPAVLEVEEVAADNLKEIKVVFNKDVDRDNVEDKDNYSTNIANVSIKDAQLVEDNTVILTLEGEMKNKKEYKLNIRGIKDGNSAVNTEFKFSALDNAIPEVLEVVGLGTKAVKVLMSEPVKAAKSSNFKIDGKTYYGSVEVAGREIILKPYGSSFGVGEHTLVVTSLEDHAGFKSIEREFKFEIVEDKEAPTVAEVKGTLERVVVTFSEDVDGSTVSKDSLYWGGTKTNKADRVIRLSGSRYAFEFSGNKALPTYETTLTVSGVKDYSANEMKTSDVAFRAEIDQTRPEVIEVKVDDEKTVIVKFNKALSDDAKDVKNYVITDEDSKKSSIKTPALSADRRTVTLSLYSELKENKDYTLKISGIRDNTKLSNTILPYEEKISAGNYKNPKVDAVTGNPDKRTIHVLFNKKMNIETIAKEDNYLVVVKGVKHLLSDLEGDVDVIQDGKAVILTLPEKINKEKVESLGMGEGKGITGVIVLGVKDTDDNMLKEYGEVVKIQIGNVVVEEAVAKESKKIELTFTQPIKDADKSDFTTNFAIDRVVVDGSKKVILESEKDIDAGLAGVYVKIDKDNTIETVLETGVEAQTINPKNAEVKTKIVLVDEIKPSLIEEKSVTASVANKTLTITLTFDEELNADLALAGAAKKDLTIKRSSDGKKLDMAKAEVVSKIVDKSKKLVIEVVNADFVKSGDAYEVEITSPTFIRDLSENVAKKTDGPVTAETDEAYVVKVKDVEVIKDAKLPEKVTLLMSDGTEVEKVATFAADVKTDASKTVKVTVEGNEYDVVLTVTEAPLTIVLIEEVKVEKDAALPAKVTALMSNGTKVEKVATFAADVKTDASKTVKVTVEGNEYNVLLTVTAPAPVEVTGVTLGKTASTLTVGEAEILAATIAPANATEKGLTWESSDPAVATVANDGKVTAVAAGTAIITVKTVSGEFTAICTVTVQQ